MSVSQKHMSFVRRLFFVSVLSLFAFIIPQLSSAQVAQFAPAVPVYLQPPTKAMVVYGFSTGTFGPYGIRYAVGSIPGTFTTYPLEQNMAGGAALSNPYTSGNTAYLDYVISNPSTSGGYSLVKQARISLSNPANKTVTTLALPPFFGTVTGFSTTLGRNALNHPATFGAIVEDTYPALTYVLHFFQYDLVTSTLQFTTLNHPISLQLSAGVSVVSNATSTSNTVDVYYVRKETAASQNLALYKITVDIANGGAQSQPVKLSGDELVYSTYRPRQVQSGPKSVVFDVLYSSSKMSVLLNNGWTPFIGLPTFTPGPSLLSDDTSVLLNRDLITGNTVNIFMVDSVPSIRSFQLTFPNLSRVVIHPRLIRDSNNQVENQLLFLTARYSGSQYTLEVHDVDANAGLVRQTYTIEPSFNAGPFDTMQIIQLP